MKTKIKSGFLVFSLILNAIFIAVLVTALFSKSSNLYYRTPRDGYVTAAAVVSVPADGEAVFDLITMSLRPGEKSFLQFSFVSSRKQANLLINALYDPGVISISNAAYGIEITALSEGETLMQTLTNDGVKNIALIRVVK
jgi:hypothetical protein